MEERKEIKEIKLLGFIPSKEDLEIFDRLQQKYYTLTKSDILRLVFKTGADSLLKKS